MCKISSHLVGSGSPNLGPSAISHAVYPISFFPIGGQACPGNIYKIFSESFSSFGAEIACSCFLPLWPISKVTQCDTSECWRCYCNAIVLHLKQFDIWAPLHYGSRFRVLEFALMVKASLKTSINRRSQNFTHRGDPPWYQCHTFSQLDQGNVIGSNQDPLRVHLDPFSRHPHLDSQKIDQRIALDVIFK